MTVTHRHSQIRSPPTQALPHSLLHTPPCSRPHPHTHTQTHTPALAISYSPIEFHIGFKLAKLGCLSVLQKMDLTKKQPILLLLYARLIGGRSRPWLSIDLLMTELTNTDGSSSHTCGRCCFNSLGGAAGEIEVRRIIERNGGGGGREGNWSNFG